MIKNNTNLKGIIYLILNLIDAMVTSFVLKMGGGELNPIYNTLLRNDILNQQDPCASGAIVRSFGTSSL